MAKFPKTVNRFCPFCNKKTEQKVALMPTGIKGGALKHGSLKRARRRGLNRGFGNQGRRSRPPVKQYKRKTKTTTKKVLIYTCTECGKSINAKKGIRTAKLLVE